MVSQEFQGKDLFTKWKLTNNTGNTLRISISGDNFTATDNNGNNLTVLGFQVPIPGGWSFCNPVAGKELPSGGSINNADCDYPLRIQFNPADCNIEDIIITVRDVSRIEFSKWKVPVSKC